MATLNPSRVRNAAARERACAADLGTIEPGCAIFAITEGAWGMLEAVLTTLRQTGPARVTLWTWALGEHDAAVLFAEHRAGRIAGATLVIDPWLATCRGDRGRRDMTVVEEWRQVFGPASVRWAKNHAKVATVEGAGLAVVIRGSTNLNANPRWEQIDITEGGPELALLRRVMDELPADTNPFDQEAVSAASKIGDR